MYEVWINLDGGTPYKLCSACDLLALWAVVESLMGEGATGVDALGIVHLRADGRQVVFRPPIT